MGTKKSGAVLFDAPAVKKQVAKKSVKARKTGKAYQKNDGPLYLNFFDACALEVVFNDENMKRFPSLSQRDFFFRMLWASFHNLINHYNTTKDFESYLRKLALLVDCYGVGRCIDWDIVRGQCVSA